MIRLLVSLGFIFTLNAPLLAHDIEQGCIEDAFDSAVNYCYRLYGGRSRTFWDCKMGVAHTYEALLTSEPTSNIEICHPYFLGSCESGRKLMLVRNEELCQ